MGIINDLIEEHRILEKILIMLAAEIISISEQNRIDPIAMHISIDCIRTYAGLSHQGKEENILFRELFKKDLLPEHTRIMKELIREHGYLRSIFAKWMDANNRYLEGENTVPEIIFCLKELIQCYSQHMQREEEHFFIAIPEYFGAGERDEIRRRFYEYDEKIFQWKYRKVETVLKKRLAATG